jgi:hypothetical protein
MARQATPIRGNDDGVPGESVGNAIVFNTEHPYDVVPRALDILRKMSFGLARLSVDADGIGFRIELHVQARGHLSLGTFVERLRLLDLWDLDELGSAPVVRAANDPTMAKAEADLSQDAITIGADELTVSAR